MNSDAAIEAILGTAPRQTPQSPPLQGTESAANAIARVKYTHDAMIDLMITNPGISQGALAKEFGYTQTWISRVINSDAFQARLAVRKHDLVDPTLAMTLDEKFKALADKSLDILQEKLTTVQDPKLALQALELSSKALGFGARQHNLNVQASFVVALPAKADSANAWAAKHGVPQSPDLARLAHGPSEVVDAVELPQNTAQN